MSGGTADQDDDTPDAGEVERPSTGGSDDEVSDTGGDSDPGASAAGTDEGERPSWSN